MKHIYYGRKKFTLKELDTGLGLHHHQRRVVGWPGAVGGRGCGREGDWGTHTPALWRGGVKKNDMHLAINPEKMGEGN